jgi:thiol-disulfide isomerase/thioredoxin
MKIQSIARQEPGKYTLIFGSFLLAGILFFAVNAFAAGVVVELSLSDFQGDTVFMAFWSTWCSRSREELTYLKELSERYPSLVFVAVNSETEVTGIQSLVYMRQAIEEYKLPIAIVVDRGMKIWNQYEVNALPTSLIISAEGQVKVLDDLSTVSLNLP